MIPSANALYENRIFETLFDIIPFGVYVANAKTYELVYTNSYFKEALGGAAAGKCYQAIYKEEKPCFHCNFHQLLDSEGRPNGKTLVYEHFNESNDRWYQMQDKCISWPTGDIVKYAIAVDITDRKRYQNDLAEAHANLALSNKKLLNQNRLQQELLIQQGKMAAIGEMLGTISHQWKQPIAGIDMVAHTLEDLVLNEGGSPEEARELFGKIHELTAFLLETMMNFLGFLKPNSQDEYFSLKEALEEGVRFLQKELTLDSVETALNIDPALQLLGPANDFKHVVLNLLNNARQAIVQSETQAGKITIHATQKEGVITLFIEDNGGGIAPQLLPDKLFENYVSTKGRAGTGLGLSVTRSIIEAKFAGTITAQNGPEGARFAISFPLKAPAAN